MGCGATRRSPNGTRGALAATPEGKHPELVPDCEVAIDSSGLAAIPGRAADPRAVHVAGERDIDLNGHRATGVDDVKLQPGAVIFAMEAKHVIELRSRFDSRPVHIYLLGCLASDGDIEIPDPFTSRRIEEFGARFDQIDEAVHNLQRLLAGRGQAASPVLGS